MEYFVTGATGFVGGEVTRQLRAAGHGVRAVVRTTSKAGALKALGVRLFEGDVTDKASMRAAMEGTDGAFHIAGWYKVGVKDTAPARPVNIDGTRNVLELMKELSIPKGVYTSTLAVFGDTKGELVDESYRMKGSPLSVYDRTKWSAHHEVAEPAMRSGLPLVIVQPGLVYGPGDTSDAGVMLRDYLQRKLRGVPRGVAYCWGHIEDTARGHILAMDKGKVGESYIIAGPKHTVIEALEVAERLTGIPAPRFHPGPRFMRFLSRGARLLGNRAATERLRVLAGATYLGSNAKAREHLGFDPRSLEAGLRETLEHEMGALGIRPRASS